MILLPISIFIFSYRDVENRVDGLDGLNILLNTREEPIGFTCPSGGTKFTFGGDINGNGVLSVDEVTSTIFICNGESGNDRTSNLSVSMIEININSVDYVEYRNSSDGGYLTYEFSSNLITNNVLNNGMVFVKEKIYAGNDNLMNLPIILVSGDVNELGYTIYHYCYYKNGKVYYH